MLAAAIFALPAMGAESGPRAVARQFCQADALGERVSAAGWPAVAPLVAWRLEPAWDHVVLIGGYSLSDPRPAGDGAYTVEVHYDVIGQLSAPDLDTAVYSEPLTLRLQATETSGWRVVGPPPAPHIFASRVDVEAMRRSLEQGGAGFVSNSGFVWQMFRSAGWGVALERCSDLFDGVVYRRIHEPRVGDLVAYLRDDTPYHVGVLEAENQIVSSTINAGIMRTAVDAFPGDVAYLRLIAPVAEVGATPTPALQALHAAPVLQPRVPARHPRPTPTPRTAKRRRPTPPSTARPAATKRAPAAAKPKRRRNDLHGAE